MLETVIDYSVFDDFCNSRPKQIPNGSEFDNDLWNSFWKFLKSGSDVKIINYSDETNIFLTNLTTGRKGTSVRFDNYKEPKNCKFPKKFNIHTFFFLNEPDINKHKKYRNNNGFIFGFINDYKEIWEEISFLNKEKVLHDRESVNESLKFSWDKFATYLIPFTDIIIRDDFIFSDKSIIKDKLGKIVTALNKTSKIKYNLLIVTNKDKLDSSFKGSLNEVYNYLKKADFLRATNLNIEIAHTRKEHDRYIFFNYLEVDFGKIPDTSSVPTKIEFKPFTFKENYESALIVLNDINDIVKTAIENKNYIGNKANRLLRFKNLAGR